MMVNLAYSQYAVTGELLDVDYYYKDIVLELSSQTEKKQIDISAEGRFFTSLIWNNVYRFTFRKNGYVTKVVEFSTHVPNSISKEVLAPYHMQIRLFKVFEGVDTVFFNNPVAKVRYDEQLSDFNDDRDYSLNVKYKIDKMRKEANNKASKNRNSTRSPFISKAKTNSAEKKYEAKNTNSIKNHNLQIEKSTVKSSIKDDSEKIPALKSFYPLGETNEEYTLRGRVAKRTIFMLNEKRRVFLSVKHNWGGQYYFIDEEKIGYRCISKDIYDLSINQLRKEIAINR